MGVCAPQVIHEVCARANEQRECVSPWIRVYECPISYPVSRLRGFVCRPVGGGRGGEGGIDDTSLYVGSTSRPRRISEFFFRARAWGSLVVGTFPCAFDIRGSGVIIAHTRAEDLIIGVV